MTRARERVPDVLPRSFYDRPVVEVARDLLGRHLVHSVDRDHLVGGRIVEVEAYGGVGDPGSHADRAGGPRGRATIMFGDPGAAYVYFTYGMHFCLNAVADRAGIGSAVLIRAVEPLWGTAWMRAAGAPSSLPDAKLASGPGRVCRAIGVARTHNGADLTAGPLRIVDGDPPDEILEGLRVGLSADDARRWRFWTPSPAVSRGPVTVSPSALTRRRG